MISFRIYLCSYFDARVQCPTYVNVFRPTIYLTAFYINDYSNKKPGRTFIHLGKARTGQMRMTVCGARPVKFYPPPPSKILLCLLSCETVGLLVSIVSFTLHGSTWVWVRGGTCGFMVMGACWYMSKWGIWSIYIILLIFI